MKVEAKTTVSTYRNKRNGNKYVEKHEDGYGHRSLKQYMKWDRDDGEVIKNPTGDGNLHRWHKDNADELLEDYEEVDAADDMVAEDELPIEDQILKELQEVVQQSIDEWGGVGTYNDEYYAFKGQDLYTVGSFDDAIHAIEEELADNLVDAIDVSCDFLETPEEYEDFCNEVGLSV